MNIRTTPDPVVRGAGRVLKQLNDRHPWDHNQHFHRWILRSLPDPCARVLDVGCGRGDLIVALAEHGCSVDGIDSDPAMSDLAARRFREEPRVRITRATLQQFERDASPAAQYDAITMVASLHHMDLELALGAARSLLRPGGRLLVVTLTAPLGLRDTVWDVGNALTNPLIGLIKHPRPAAGTSTVERMPVRDPEMGFAELRERTGAVLPGARLRRREGFRVTLAWQKPQGGSESVG